MPSDCGIDRRPLWPLSPPPQLDPQRAERDVELVVDRRRAGPAGPCRSSRSAGHRPAGLVHVRSRLGQHEPRRRPDARAGPRRRRPPRLVRLEPRRRTRAASSSATRKPDVVPVAGVRRAGVAEPDDQPDGPASSVTSVCRSASRPSLAGGGAAGAPRRTLRRRPRRASMPRLGLGGLGSASSAPRASASAARRSASVARSSCSAVGPVERRRRVGQLEVAPAGIVVRRSARPSMSTSTCSGMWVASASTESVFSCSVDQAVAAAASPVSVTGTSTVTFSPRRTSIRSTCSRLPLIGSRWIALGSASWLPPSTCDAEQRVGAVLEREHRARGPAG